MLIRLHVNGEVALCCGGVVADFAPVWLIATGVSLAPGQPWMLLASDAVNAGGFTFWVLLLHVDLQSFLILVVPVAFGTLESFAGVSCSIPAHTSRHSIKDDVAL